MPVLVHTGLLGPRSPQSYIVAQVSQLAIAALVCKKVDSDYLLAYDSRIDCQSAEYKSYCIFSWLMLALWPIGCPLLLLLLLKSYKVPEMVTRKRRVAELKAFMLHTLAIAEVSEAELKTLVAMATLEERSSATEPAEPASTDDAAATEHAHPAETAATEAAATERAVTEHAATDAAVTEPAHPAHRGATYDSADFTEPAAAEAALTEPANPAELSPAEPIVLPEHDRSSSTAQQQAAELPSNFEGMNLLQLRAIGRAHAIDGFSTLSAASLAAQLTARMKELIESEEVVVPLLLWDENSTDLDEERAVKHLDSLIGAYESTYWWCEFFDQVAKCM
jgi:hypothetical protein